MLNLIIQTVFHVEDVVVTYSNQLYNTNHLSFTFHFRLNDWDSMTVVRDEITQTFLNCHMSKINHPQALEVKSCCPILLTALLVKT